MCLLYGAYVSNSQLGGFRHCSYRFRTLYDLVVQRAVESATMFVLTNENRELIQQRHWTSSAIYDDMSFRDAMATVPNIC